MTEKSVSLAVQEAMQDADPLRALDKLASKQGWIAYAAILNAVSKTGTPIAVEWTSRFPARMPLPADIPLADDMRKIFHARAKLLERANA